MYIKKLHYYQKVSCVKTFKRTRRKIAEAILLNFRSNLGHMDKLEII